MILESLEGHVRAVFGDLIQTTKADKKQRSNLRVSTDDQRRLREVWEGLDGHVRAYSPVALGLEVYSAYQAGPSAWKTSMVYGLAQAVGMGHGLLVLPFLPTDLKKAFALKKNTSKGAVGENLYERVMGLREIVEAYPKTKREHLTDAAGHAFLTFEEITRMRRSVGML